MQEVHDGATEDSAIVGGFDVLKMEVGCVAHPIQLIYLLIFWNVLHFCVHSRVATLSQSPPYSHQFQGDLTEEELREFKAAMEADNLVTTQKESPRETPEIVCPSPWKT